MARTGAGLPHDSKAATTSSSLHTCGKALGGFRRARDGPAALCDYLVNRCRPFIYATAPSPLMAAAVTEALAILREEPERREQLTEIVAFAGRESRGAAGRASGSQILPVIIGDNARAMALAERLQARGFDVRGIRPPTVPEGTARLSAFR